MTPVVEGGALTPPPESPWPDRPGVCRWCHQPIWRVYDSWWSVDRQGVCGPESWLPTVFPPDVFDVPDPTFGGQSYREAVFRAAPSRWSPGWTNRPPCLVHVKIDTWWWEKWGPEPEWVLADRRTVDEVLAAHGLRRWGACHKDL